jgi:hypothetical protein
MTRFLKVLLAAAIALPALLPLSQANAAATTQTLHAFLCAQESYNLNGAGCAVIANADIGYFLSQGFTYGPNEVALQQIAITANTTATTSTITIPAYAYIKYFVLEETAGNAITGGVDIGDAGSAIAYQSAVALGANATVLSIPTATRGIFSNAGVPQVDQILVACHTLCNSGSINISVIVGYY